MYKLSLFACIAVPAFLTFSPVLADAPPSSSDSTSPSAAAATAPVTTAPVEDPNERICKASGTPTGTRLGSHRICMTRKEWNDQDKAALQIKENAGAKETQMTTPAPPAAGGR